MPISLCEISRRFAMATRCGSAGANLAYMRATTGHSSLMLARSAPRSLRRQRRAATRFQRRSPSLINVKQAKNRQQVCVDIGPWERREERPRGMEVLPGPVYATHPVMRLVSVASSTPPPLLPCGAKNLADRVHSQHRRARIDASRRRRSGTHAGTYCLTPSPFPGSFAPDRG